ATALRGAEKALDDAAKRWPGLSDNLAKAAKALRDTQKKLQSALGHRDDLESGLRQTVGAMAQFVDSLPRALETLDEGLARQERSLGELGDRIDEASEELPVAGRKVGRLLETLRLLFALVAGLVGLHAGHRLTVALAWPRSAASGGPT